MAAARALVDERGPSGFTTDDLAARADVSRRTVFNHFSHLEDVVVAAVEAQLASAITAVQADLAASQARSGPLDDLEAILSTPELATTLSWLGRALSGPGCEPAAERVREQAMRQFGAGTALRLRERYPDVAPLELELLTTVVANGMAVVATAWLDETEGALDDASRRRWSELLAVLFSAVRDGFGRRVGAAVTASHAPASTLARSTEGA
ncbi:transcriptional regulator, TetR family [Quadrisphaera granulorum]|uniref:TetR family transcriptional regulator n=1 Tax=Quadrisphaera granulorum TaxID=317664 RepID=A0A316A536_9ACTN|nr:TetR family transcriptional regulator [Quadrisphaera granulorum]SZE97176.1 transcriptional regulator, TetR family [Quadrisphaera granulorum]